MKKDNIIYSVEEESTDDNSSVDLNELLNNFENIEVCQEEDFRLAQMDDYDMNYSLKQLGIIYEYYGLGKISKIKKMDMICAIVLFENDPKNIDIIMKRRQMWFYLDELKSDKFMKRFLLL